jgi:hypothetical protein
MSPDVSHIMPIRTVSGQLGALWDELRAAQVGVGFFDVPRRAGSPQAVSR